jgi:hypothetical protein
LHSILKNLFNSLNTKVGEIFRIVGSKEYCIQQFNIIFIDITPIKTFKKDKDDFELEDVQKRYNKLTPIKNHPWLKNMDNLYLYNIWFTPSETFFDASKKAGLNLTNFISEIDAVDFTKFP